MIKVEQTRIINHSSADIYKAVTDNANFGWRSDLKEIKVIDDTHFIEYTKKDFLTFFTVKKNIKNREYLLTLDNNNLEGKILVELKVVPEGTELLISEEVEVLDKKKKIFFKMFLRKQQNRYLTDLIKYLDEKNG